MPSGRSGVRMSHDFGLMVIVYVLVMTCGVCWLSRTVTVIGKAPAVAGVPIIKRADPLSCVVVVRPEGSPVTDQEYGPSPPSTAVPTCNAVPIVPMLLRVPPTIVIVGWGKGTGVYVGWLRALAEAVADTVCEVAGGAVWFAAGCVVGALHVSVYVAGLEAVVTGLVTTRTAAPEPEAPGGVIVSGSAAWVPGLVNVRVAGAEFAPSDSAQ